MIKRAHSWVAVLASALFVAGCGGDGDRAAASGQPPGAVPAPAAGGAAGQGRAPDPAGVKTVDVATGLSYPWGLAFLPDRRMLVTEKGGQMRVVSADGIVGAPLAGNLAKAGHEVTIAARDPKSDVILLR